MMDQKPKTTGFAPVTPAPSRFLLPSKRQSNQQIQHQDQTPNQQNTYRPHRFHATPRFAATPGAGPSNHTHTPTGAPATPRLPPLSANQATARSSRNWLTQEIIDDESSQPSSPAGLGNAPPSDRQSHLPEPIEIDSSFVSQSPYSKLDYHHQPDNGRSPKRRRISITSSESDLDLVADSQPPVTVSPFTSRPSSPHIEDPILPDTPSDEEDEDPSKDHIDTLRIPPTPSPIPSSPSSHPQSSSHLSSSPISPSHRTHRHHPHRQQQQQQPTFHPPPRFKPDIKPPTTNPISENLTTLFSPQRRGARYLPGGLASELRDWLMEIKDTDFSPLAQPHSAVRLAVEQVRHGGAGMTLIEGRPVGEGGVLGGKTKVVLTG
ncbi:hypothetical protein B0T14DRAFT_599709, partial [Immersiella caudata]